MLQYLIILLDHTSVSFCHYDVPQSADSKLISFEHLQKGILFAMKENLSIQFVYPPFPIPQTYLDEINKIDHVDIISTGMKSRKTSIAVQDKWDGENTDAGTYVIRTTRKEMTKHIDDIRRWISKVERLNIVVTDIASFKDSEIEAYEQTLKCIAEEIAKQYGQGHPVQVSIVTDRIMLDHMNNCNAGINSITLAPNGHFYLCPAFYYDDEQNEVGSIDLGSIEIKNQRLLRLENAPICRKCDAYQCRRCVWMNQKLTLELNTPSHQQCVVAHVERRASQHLLTLFDNMGLNLDQCQDIPDLNYLDPFKICTRWK